MYPIFSSSTINHSCFTLKLQGKSLPNLESYSNEPNTIQEITNLIQKDVIQGLLATNIHTRLHYLMTLDIPEDILQDILSILCRIARHSKEASILCLNHSKNWLDKCFSRSCTTALLHFMRDVMCGSRDNATTLVLHGGLDFLFRIVSCIDNDLDSSLAWTCLSILTCYSLGIDEIRLIRPLFFSKAASYLVYSRDEYHLKCRIGLLNTLRNFIHATYLEYEMGGSGDEIKPFVDLVLSLYPFESVNGSFFIVKMVY